MYLRRFGAFPLAGGWTLAKSKKSKPRKKKQSWIDRQLSGLSRWFKAKAKAVIASITGRGYSHAYEKRLIRGELKGKTKQHARGHKPKEHVERKKRELEELGGLTSAQIKSITNFHTRFMSNETKQEPSLDDLIDYVRETGYELFKSYRSTWDGMRKQYLRDLKDGSWVSKGQQYLEVNYQLAGMQEPADIGWLYYH